MLRICFVIFLAVSVMGCSDTEPRHFDYSVHDKTMHATTPVTLKKLANSTLELHLMVGAITQTYSGANFPDDTWRIDLNLMPDQTYDADFKWYSNGHLVLHEFGSFTTDNNQRTVTLDLDFADEGPGGFDDDCDGISNLDELTASTPVGEAGLTDCGFDETLINPEAIYVVRNYQSFVDSGYQERVNSYEQDIRVRAFNPNRNLSYWMGVINSAPSFAEAIDVTVELSYSDAFRKNAYFRISEALDAVAEFDGTCGTFETSGQFCRVPFEWQEQRWYTLRIDRVAAGVWEASIKDNTTLDVQTVGQITTSTDLEWSKPRYGISYRGIVTDFETCRAGLPRIAMQAKQGVANEAAEVTLADISLSRCVDAGIGWRSGTRYTDGDRTYMLSVGDGRL